MMPSPGFVASMIARAAAAVTGANRAIRCLIILAHVISADETPIRVGPGPKARKKYLLVACTNLLTYYFLGDRSLTTFTAFVLPDMGGAVVVHDRYQNYDAIPGLIHQLCAQHILRDLASAAETYPGAHWPVPASQALQGLIHAANTARAQGLPAIPGEVAAPLIHAFKHGVLVGLSQIPRVPAGSRNPAATCSNACATGRPTYSVSARRAGAAPRSRAKYQQFSLLGQVPAEHQDGGGRLQGGLSSR
jgi:transposase